MVHLFLYNMNQGKSYSPNLYESIITNKLDFTLIMKGILGKIRKSSFKRSLYSTENNDNLLGHYLAGFGFCLLKKKYIFFYKKKTR